MHSDVHPLVAALVLALTVAALGIWTWGSGVAQSIGGPAELRTGPDGHHYIQIQDLLIEHDADGNYRATHDIGELGTDAFLGGFAFFSNGDVLLRLGSDPRSFADNFRAYQRKTNTESITPEAPGSGLFRCNLDAKSCHRFGAKGIDFKAAYGIDIDWRTDDVFVSDTTRHVLRKFSSQGVPLAGPVEGFKFPNQISVHNDQLYVADTNNHVIQSVSAATASFGNPRKSFYVVPDQAKRAEQRWPSHFVRVGNEWWTNNMQAGMNQGGIYVFDDRWNFDRRIVLPTDADPVALLPVGNEVWVSDWNNDLVHRISAKGDRSDLESAGLQAVLAVSRDERRKYRYYSYSGVILLAFVFLALLVRALAVGMH